MATAIGRIESIEGSAEVLHADGSIGALLQGTTVYANDVITTDGDSNLGIRFLDGSGMKIDPESSVTLDEGAVNPGLIPEDDGSSQVILDASGRAINPDSGHANAGIGEKIGSVETLQGTVEAVSDDATVRVLKTGDPLYASDVIRVDSNGNVSIRMVDGSDLSFGPGTTARLEDSVPFTPAQIAESGLTDPVQIQTAIQAGRDPSQEATAPAAGGIPGSNEGGIPVILSSSPRAVTPFSGHETHGFELPFRIPEEEEQIGIEEDDRPTVILTYVAGDFGVVQEKGLPERSAGPAGTGENADGDGTNNDDKSETTKGGIIIHTGDDLLGALEVKDKFGEWIDVTGGGTVQGENGVLTVTTLGDLFFWSYTLSNVLSHDDVPPNVPGSSVTGADDQLPGEALAVRVKDGEGDISPEVLLKIVVYDDGPDANVNDEAPLDMLTLDESPEGTDSEDGVAPLGKATTMVDFSDNFVTTIHYGADGAGRVDYQLELSSEGVASGLHALDATDILNTDGDGIGQGAEIKLYTNGTTGAIEGKLGAAATTVYFTLSVNNDATSADFGKVTFSQDTNIWHDTTSDHDEAMTLTTNTLVDDEPTDDASLLKITQTVTDADGDSDAASIDLGARVFKIEDDGPDAKVNDEALLDMLTLDESDEPAPAEAPVVDDGVDDGIRSAMADFSDNFITTIDYGTDGAGRVDYQLELSSEGVASGLHALDATDILNTDGDGIGQGAEIKLYTNGTTGAIEGKLGAAATTVYFTLSVNNDATSADFGKVTFSQDTNIWHDTTSDHDEAMTLTTNTLVDDEPTDDASLLKITQTVTDADGDSDAASIDLGANVFKIEDDGPIADLDVLAKPTFLVLDETLAGTPSAVGDSNADDETHVNAPTDAIGYAEVTGASLFADNSSFGTDGSSGLDAKVFSLTLSSEDVDSSLDDTATKENILLSTDAGGNIEGRTSGTDELVFEIHVDVMTGDVSVAQFRAIVHDDFPTDHDESDDPESIGTGLVGLTVRLTDGDGDTDTDAVGVDLGPLILFEDDGPTATPVMRTGEAVQEIDTNLMLILDVSGSMNSSANFQGMTRLEVMIKSSLEVIEQYDAFGDVKVNIVTFNSSADNPNDEWVDVTTAKEIILGLTAGGGTNYDAALNQAWNAFGEDGAIDDAQAISYFMSDGKPNKNSIAGTGPAHPPLGGGDGIDVDEEGVWRGFLEMNNINSFSLGMGPGAVPGELDPIAYDGTDGDGMGMDTDAIIVSDFSQLEEILVGTIEAPPFEGDFIEGGGGGGNAASIGTDKGGWLQSITVDSVTYSYNQTDDTHSPISPSGATFNDDTNEWTVTTVVGATLTVDMDTGKYKYTPPSPITAAINEVFGYVVVDGDGDTAASMLTVTIELGEGPSVVRDDFVITNMDEVTIPDQALLANDTGPNSATQVLSVVSDPVDGTIVDDPDLAESVTFNFDDNTPPAEGSFVYTNTINGDSDTASVDVNRVSGNTLTGGILDEILIGGSANEILDGGVGNDVLVGADGDDTMTGGFGNDTFVWLAGNTDNDTVTDFSPGGTQVLKITADGEKGSDNTDYLQFEFLSGTAYIESIVIDLRGGSDTNAEWDPADGSGGFGPDYSSLNGLTVDNISTSFTDSDSVMTLTFDSNTFNPGDSFDLNVEVDDLSGNDGDDFGDKDVPVTVTFSNGEVQNLVFHQSDSETSVAEKPEGDVLNIADLLVDEELLDHTDSTSLAAGLVDDFISVATGADTMLTLYSGGGGPGTPDDEHQVINLPGYNTTGMSPVEVIDSLLDVGSLITD